VQNAFVDRSVENASVLSRFQFERVGFFAVDRDSTKEKVKFFIFLSRTGRVVIQIWRKKLSGGVRVSTGCRVYIKLFKRFREVWMCFESSN